MNIKKKPKAKQRNALRSNYCETKYKMWKEAKKNNKHRHTATYRCEKKMSTYVVFAKKKEAANE